MKIYAVNFEDYPHQDWLTTAEDQLSAVRNVSMFLTQQSYSNGCDTHSKLQYCRPNVKIARGVHRRFIADMENERDRGRLPVVST